MTEAAKKSATPSWVRAYLAKYRGQVALALALGLFAAACSALLMFVSGYLMSATAVPGMTLFAVMVPIASVQVFGLGRPLARYFERLISHDWVLRITSDLRLRLFNAVERRSGDPLRARATGEYLAVLNDDIAHLQNLYLRVVFPTLVALLLLVLASVLFGFFSVPLLCVMLVVGLACVVILPLATWLADRALMERAKSLRDAEYDELADDVFGAVDWSLSGRGAEVTSRHVSRDASMRALDGKALTIINVMQTLSAIVLIAGICATIFIAGGASSQDAGMANWIAALVLGFFPLFEVFTVLPGSVSDATNHTKALANLDELIADEPAAAEPGAAAVALEGADAPALSLESVSYTYPEAASATLDGLDFSVPAGQKVAILGKSGSGKSTLAALARGLIAPDSGTASLFGTDVSVLGNGVHSALSYTSQNPYLFIRPLRENLNLGNPEAPDDELVAALRAVGLGEKLASLPDGLDTMVGETGVGFSGGEAHRVAIARMIVSHAPVIVLDEPFASLDPATERGLLDTLLDVFADKTVVVITHHLMGIERFDRVVFMENGAIEMDGSPATLAAENARYRTLLSFDRGEA